ncbi:MAG: hypothetical protein ACYDCO_07525 [Armatimonadota bacterium]
MPKASNWMTNPPLGWGQWVALFSTISFAMLGFDAGMNHHRVLANNPITYMPLIFAMVAVVYCLVSVYSVRWRRAAWVAGLLAVTVGIAGTLFHNVPTIIHRGDLTIWQALLNAYRPVLAPAAFAASGMLLLLVAWAERWQMSCESNGRYTLHMKGIPEMRYLSLVAILGITMLAMVFAGCRSSKPSESVTYQEQHSTATPVPSQAQTTSEQSPEASVALAAGEAACPVTGTVMKKIVNRHAIMTHLRG